METSFIPLTAIATGRIGGWKALGLLLWLAQLALGWYKVGPWLLVLAVLWGALSHVQDYMNSRLGAVDSSRIRFISWGLAAGLGLFLSLFRFPSVSLSVPIPASDPSTTACLYLIGSLLLVVLPELISLSPEEETLRVAGGLASLTACFFLSRFDLAFYALLSVLNFFTTAAITYESEDPDLPLNRSQKSILTHILSHKDSSRLAAFFL